MDNQDDFQKALELLEQAKESKNQVPKEEIIDNTSGWTKFINFLNPFKCG